MTTIKKFKSSERLKLKKAFGALVRNRRLKLGYSQESLGFESGLHRTYIGSIERGEANVSLENLAVLALTLGCEIKDLLPSLKS